MQNRIMQSCIMFPASRMADHRTGVSDVGQVRTSLERSSQENVREEHEELRGSYSGSR